MTQLEQFTTVLDALKIPYTARRGRRMTWLSIPEYIDEFHGKREVTFDFNSDGSYRDYMWLDL